MMINWLLHRCSVAVIIESKSVDLAFNKHKTRKVRAQSPKHLIAELAHRPEQINVSCVPGSVAVGAGEGLGVEKAKGCLRGENSRHRVRCVCWSRKHIVL
ncbi:uncharacterized protein MONOS_17833 [Monocercomonoides exilis]|uniref:uncharacterized protein n=1 Tax=Monocercomonoides exilis TaxID=2049356 RepID=UPI003559469B|nr:hypothetical protein MONOS_17833 [Monocercomonoides exilis]